MDVDAVEGEYDYIIVGAGTAGCVLANRLSADRARRVLLHRGRRAGRLDPGSTSRSAISTASAIRAPTGCSRPSPTPGLNGRSLLYPRGKVLGGSSSINGMIYMRGQARDYDGWRQLGARAGAGTTCCPFQAARGPFTRRERRSRPCGGEWRVEKQRLSWEMLDAFRRGGAGRHPADR